MSKHTKGPWIVAATHSQLEVVNQYPEQGRTWELQATASTPANARLIAAAPELLNLAKQIVPMIKSGQLDTLCDLAEIVIEQAESGTKK